MKIQERNWGVRSHESDRPQKF